MSVPAAFAPVENGGRLLVDGGLVENLPVAGVRMMRAEIVIAGNIDSPLLSREELGSILGVGLQMLNIVRPPGSVQAAIFHPINGHPNTRKLLAQTRSTRRSNSAVLTVKVPRLILTLNWVFFFSFRACAPTNWAPIRSRYSG